MSDVTKADMDLWIKRGDDGNPGEPFRWPIGDEGKGDDPLTIGVSPFRMYKMFFGDSLGNLSEGGDLHITFGVIEVSVLDVAPGAVFFVLLCPLMWPFSEEGDINELDRLIPASSGIGGSVSDVDTPAVAPAAFFAPSIAIGSADLIAKARN